MDDYISRRAAIDALFELYEYQRDIDPTEAADLVRQGVYLAEKKIERLPSAQPERIWHSCKTPPKHHKDVLVRGTEAIGNVTIYKVMQWDVDTWRPTDYAPSIIWEEWSEIYE